MQTAPKPLAMAAAAVLLMACTPEAVPVVEASRDCADAFGSQLCAWSETMGDSLVAAGVDLPIALVEAAPSEAPEGPMLPVAVMSFPAAVAEQGGLGEITFWWEAVGHPPEGYLPPHFDFHFYFAGTQPRGAITCSDTTKPDALPAGYTLMDMPLPPEMAEAMGTDMLVGLCVPEMGMHATPEADLDGSPWTGSIILGYYGGMPLFVEPMITRAKLLERQSFSYPIPAIPGMTGIHPRQFNATWNPDAASYRFSFSDFGV